jgi:tetratricopeptide (TPR) repeat protein
LIAQAQRAVAAGRLAEAQDALLAALARDGTSFDALLGMATLAERGGDLSAARHYYARLADAQPRDVRAHFAQANFHARQYEFPEARASYRRAVECDATQAGVWNNLGNVEKYLGNLPESIACYDRSIACDPTTPRCTATR